VKKLKRGSILAGNKFTNLIYKLRTSEALCNGVIVYEDINIEKIKSISVHVPTHKRPLNDTELGHYLAGLIDGDGHFNNKQKLVIAFNSLDTQLAYYLKKEIGYGHVQKDNNKNAQKDNNKNALLFVVSGRKGIERVIKLINGKLRSQSKLDQIYNNILNNPNFSYINKEINFNLNKNNDLKNLWLAGFSDANASFQIKIVNPEFSNKIEVRLNFQTDQKRNDLLLLIKKFLGGNIDYIKSQDTYSYYSTSFRSARIVLNYFDHYHLLSFKHVNYLKWRKAYIIIQNKGHLTEKGLKKIIKLESSIIKYN
jgi:hypothetical protein